MKKFIFLFLISIMGLISASGRDPVIKLNANTNKYEIHIDGRSFLNTGNIYLFEGAHKVEVYKVKKGFFGKRRVLISKADFDLANSDLMIHVNDAGQVSVDEEINYSSSKGTGKQVNQKGVDQKKKPLGENTVSPNSKV